jgi:di/tricarboxylate transporter
MEKTGAAALIAATLTGWLGGWGPQAVLSGILLLTMLLTSVLNNQAAAVLLAPMVIEMGHSLSVDPRAFLMAVAFGASLSFITPIGYQTNTMIYGPGQYRFSDFFRVGIGLNILLWILGTLLIPLAWPLTP